MDFYYFILFVCILIGIPIRWGDKFISVFFIHIIYILLFLLSIFRVDIGIDYIGHYNAFVGIINDSAFYVSRYAPEFFFWGICKLCGILNFDYKICVAIISFLTIYPIYKITNKNNYFFIIMFFVCACFLTSFCLMRQFAAVSMGTYAIYLYLHSKRKKGLLWMIFSCGMHSSFIIFYIFFFLALCFKKKKIFMFPKYALLFTSVILIISVLSTRISLSFLSSLGGYAHYLTSSYSNELRRGSGLGILLRFCSYFLLFYVNNFSTYSKDERRGIFNFLLCMLLFFDVWGCTIKIVSRVRYIFYPVMFYFPVFASISNTPKRTLSVSYWCIIFFCISYLIFFETTAVAWGNIPYMTWIK